MVMTAALATWKIGNSLDFIGMGVSSHLRFRLKLVAILQFAVAEERFIVANLLELAAGCRFFRFPQGNISPRAHKPPRSRAKYHVTFCQFMDDSNISSFRS